MIHSRPTGSFNVFRREDFTCGTYLPSNRRDFYKISLITKGNGLLSYADKSIMITGHALVFSNPNIPYAWEAATTEQAGYFCVFTNDFIYPGNARSVAESPLFKLDGTPVFLLDQAQSTHLGDLFERMLSEHQTDYALKDQVLYNYVQLVIHEALKLQPTDGFVRQFGAAERITSLFLKLLEHQFPIDSKLHTLPLRFAKQYAYQLSLHINHLNRAVKEVTGKSTTQLIAERITAEAKALLRHTDWNVAEIAYCLGFEDPAYFTNFIRKHTRQPPSALRRG
ncbi:helix-turn-helix domain-containing protein [Hymenobacter montanus]|uniref:helix-turn-helix domain-containing protein n=1 Tax=Hymenobacter montanus TaxID=2771359 RepID=UPI00293B9686|nr:helix-turn-helix transcriptional regulator [Hymenobacter montanus]